MPTDQNGLPDFENPPVIEVVCGVQFEELVDLKAPHMGLLWDFYKPDFPFCQEKPPLSPTIERAGHDGTVTTVPIELHNVPPLPRIWFVNEDNNGIIQLQKDRFHYNWKKVQPTDDYPRFETVFKGFRERYDQFVEFVAEKNFGQITPLQYELTYINHIFEGEGWSELKDLASVFPDFAFNVKNERFLPEPERFHWRTSFLLPNDCGRMHVSIRIGFERATGKRLIVLDLTVRGMCNRSFNDWFSLAREWIVCGFVDLTGKDIQQNVWRRY